MNKESKDISFILLLFAILFGLFIVIDWSITFKIVNLRDWNQILLIYKSHFYKNALLIRVLYVLCYTGYVFASPSFKMNKDDSQETRPWVHSLSLLLVVAVIIGFKITYLYGLVIYPILFVALVFFLSKSINALRNNLDLPSENKGVSCLPENDMSFEFKTDKGLMRIHSPQQGIYIEGGAGSGKSASNIEPILDQACAKKFAGIVYDFKGNPPTLSRTVYKSLNRYKQKDKSNNVTFAIINFSDLSRSARVNPLNPKYIKNELFATEAANTIMLNLNKSWIEKKDFWADNAISILDATIKMFYRNYPHYCTLPHVVSAILTNYEGLLNFLSTDPEIEKVMLPVLVAHKKNAAGQTAGAISSVQLPLNKLYNKEIYWVLSPTGQDELDLDITDPNNPRMLCIANNPTIRESLSPAISLIIGVCMQNMNQQGKNKSIFCIDELPTIFINKLDDLPATARSNKVVTCLAVQSFAQLERDYGKQNAQVIVGNLGNQFVGMTNENRTAQRIVEMYGETKYKDYSFSESESGMSQSESIKKEKIFQLRDIMGQKPGHFTGKIAGGEPPMFHVQLPQFKKNDSDNSEIPPFALDNLEFRTGDMAVDLKIFEEKINANFKRINEEVKALLAPYMPLEEND